VRPSRLSPDGAGLPTLFSTLKATPHKRRGRPRNPWAAITHPFRCPKKAVERRGPEARENGVQRQQLDNGLRLPAPGAAGGPHLHGPGDIDLRHEQARGRGGGRRRTGLGAVALRARRVGAARHRGLVALAGRGRRWLPAAAVRFSLDAELIASVLDWI
jgi:hypothetical protein